MEGVEYMRNIHEIIRQKLTNALHPQSLEIINESNSHENHIDQSNSSHFRLIIVADKFNGLSRIARQRLVYNLLASELQNHIHALSIRTLTPDEI